MNQGAVVLGVLLGVGVAVGVTLAVVGTGGGGGDNCGAMNCPSGSTCCDQACCPSGYAVYCPATATCYTGPQASGPCDVTGTIVCHSIAGRTENDRPIRDVSDLVARGFTARSSRAPDDPPREQPHAVAPAGHPGGHRALPAFAADPVHVCAPPPSVVHAGVHAATARAVEAHIARAPDPAARTPETRLASATQPRRVAASQPQRAHAVVQQPSTVVPTAAAAIWMASSAYIFWRALHPGPHAVEAVPWMTPDAGGLTFIGRF